MSIFVGIAGGTGSGKSTLAINLCKKHPDRCTIVHIDDYFKHTNELQTLNGFANWEHPSAVRFEDLYQDLLSLKAGKSISVLTKSELYNPEFRESLKNRIAYTIELKEIIVLEGYLALHDPQINSLLDKKIYLDIPIEKSLKRRSIHNKFDVDPVYFEKVLAPMHKEFVELTKHNADVIINVLEKNQEEVYSEIEKMFIIN